MFIEGYLENGIGEDATRVHDQDALMERIFEAEVSTMNDDERKMYLESEEVKNLQEIGVIGRKTIVRLSKQDDLSRRIKLAAFQKAKEQNSPEWKALKKNRIMERKLINKIMQRYGNTVKRDAVKAQRALLKITPNLFTRPLR